MKTVREHIDMATESGSSMFWQQTQLAAAFACLSTAAKGIDETCAGPEATTAMRKILEAANAAYRAGNYERRDGGE